MPILLSGAFLSSTFLFVMTDLALAGTDSCDSLLEPWGGRIYQQPKPLLENADIEALLSEFGEADGKPVFFWKRFVLDADVPRFEVEPGNLWSSKPLGLNRLDSTLEWMIQARSSDLPANNRFIATDLEVRIGRRGAQLNPDVARAQRLHRDFSFSFYSRVKIVVHVPKGSPTRYAKATDIEVLKEPDARGVTPD